jgi:predicted nucleic acid-binding protein
VASIYTVDASVFLSAFNPYEFGHRDSYSLLDRFRTQATPIVEPTMLLPEVAAAVSRGREDETLAREFAAAVRLLPHLIWIPLDDMLAQQAVYVAAQHRLRGSDAVYAAVAQRFGSVLITLDREQRERVGQVIVAQFPAEALSEVG